MEPVYKSMAKGRDLPPHILVMEDEMSIANGVKMVLNEQGYMVDLAFSGKSALSARLENHVDLLIADLKLPDIEGIDVIKQFKYNQPETEVIVITGYSSIPSVIETMKLGVCDYLPKPFTEDELVAAVNSVFLPGGVYHKTKMDAAGPAEIEVPDEPVSAPDEVADIREFLKTMPAGFKGCREDIIPMLQKTQRRFGYIPEASMEAISEATGAELASVYGVATFYEQFRLKPVGRHIVKVCRGTACHVKGANRIIGEIDNRFHLSPGHTAKDRSFTMETVACFGSCAIAPVVVIDDHVKGRMNPAKTCKEMEDIRQK